ncbi:beta-1,4-mannosyl-glycoprotein 4-beta-N-acetylglucosaminyltransferase a [Electrophorus electricus]|uniref:Beta-1,4-mannosyl-glycoprotein 4-beta-N-acetylglucosaminyltransferase b n=1 Tax=Electrophorus electricus TaxID=8005 RepID=A0A4W4GVC8_ELEEL|nr:beta-1,4-mannosyl-glycoprotein 4-beta-N-acetylglucosaminyltransferase a [Electrophorus electricus]
MRVRRRRLFLLCCASACVVSLLSCYGVFHLPRQGLHLKTTTILGGFLWGDPLVATHPQSNLLSRIYNHNVAEKSLKQNSYRKDLAEEVLVLPDPTGPNGELHKRAYVLHDDLNSYFARTETGDLCFREGMEVASPKVKERETIDNTGLRIILHHQEEENQVPMNLTIKVEQCVCRPAWHGPECGVPTVVQHSNIPTKSHLSPRKVPRRIINAININHEFDLLHTRFHELADAVDVFLVCESNFTAYGKSKPLTFLQLLLNGTFNYVKHKILYIFLDHFPRGGRINGWIADDYLRTFLTKNGLSRIWGLRPDDVFLLNDADEIPLREGIIFLKLYDGWTEPFGIHLRKSLYGFYWKQLGTLDVLSGCTVAMLIMVYRWDGILLRRRDYYTMPGFRQYENASGSILMPWSIGSPVHYAGWHCSWCFKPEGIHYKLISAQNGDFPRWGDFEEKRKLSYIRGLIRTGGWFDGSKPQYPPTHPKEHMFAPKYLLDNYERYHYLLENPYAKP